MRKRQTLAALGLATLAAGCGVGEVVDSAAGGQEHAGMTTVEPTFPGAEDSEESSTSSSPAQSSEGSRTSDSTEASTRSSASTTAKSSGSSNSEADFSDLTERDALYYTGNGNSSLAGTRFTSPTGNIQCHITGEGAGCVVEEHQAWPAKNRYDDGIPEATPAVIGWYPGTIGQRAPQHWKQQGSWPSRGTGVELPYGTYLDVVTDIDGETPNVRCGSRETGMTCVAGSHGFSVSRETYEVW